MATVHIGAFPEEFLSLLGRAFLKKFYGYYMSHAGGICLVAVDSSSRVAGLVTGGQPELRAAFLRKHVLRFILTSLWKSVYHARVRQRLCEHLARAWRRVASKLRLVKSQANQAPPEDPKGTWSNLLSVCVHPDFRGKGVGRLLMEAFRADSARRGFKTMRLSVHNDNDPAIALYAKCGWKAVLTTPAGTYFRRSVEEEE
jgi:ribosomal protein S18 acetylase RimI-like enzyme